MSESPLHRHISKYLASIMRANDVVVPYSPEEGRRAPYAVGRHSPDVIGFSERVQYNGEAECGPDLFASHTLDQIHDFACFARPGYRPVLVLCVPPRYEADAWEAVRRAGAPDSATMVLPAPLLKLRRRTPIRHVGRQQPVPESALAALRGSPTRTS